MNWIIFFTQNQISYHVYKLNQGDSIILNNKKNSNTMIILTGIISLAKVFCNQELLPIAILGNNDIITNHNNTNKNYKIVALKTTYIIRLINTSNIEIYYSREIIKYYEKTINKYEEVINLMSQQSKKRRILIFILIVFLRFGRIKKSNIFIPFKLKKDCIAIMTATGINTVSKILKKRHMNEQGGIHSINIKNLKLI